MATRFYLGYNEARSPGHQYAYDSSWEQVSLIHRQKLRRTKLGQVVTTQNYVRAIPGSMDILEYFGISEPLDVDQNIAGTFVGVSRFQQSNTGMNARVQLVVRVIKPDGTVRGVLWGPDEGAAGDAYSGYSSKIIPRGGPVALTPVAALAGDRISIELGTKVHHTGSNGYTTNLWLGDSTATDMTLSTGNAESLNPWFEFSQDLTFKSEANLGRISMDVVTKQQGAGKLARISADIITKMQGTGKLARLSMDVVVPQGMPNTPQLQWGAPFYVGYAGSGALENKIASLNPTWWWKLDELAGTVANDSGSANSDMDYIGAYALGADGLDNSNSDRKALSGTGGGVRSAGSLVLGEPGVDEITMLILFKPATVSGTLRSICGIEGSSTYQGDSFQIRHDNDDLVALVGGTGGAGSAGWTVADQLVANQRYMLALKRTATTARLYKNGVPIGTAQAVSNDLAANNRFGIGMRGSDGGRPGTGVFQHCVVFKNQTISDADILLMAQMAGVWSP